MGDRNVALQRDTPRNWFRVAAAIVAVTGVASAFAWFAYALGEQGRHVESFITLPPQSGFMVEVPDAGVYTLWASAISGGYVGTPSVDELLETMTVGFDGPVDSADPVRVDPVPMEDPVRYRVDGQNYGVGVWTVEFDEAGTYELERVNTGRRGVKLSLGEGIGMPSRITSGLVVIGATTTVLLAVLLGVGAVHERRRITAMLADFDSYGR